MRSARRRVTEEHAALGAAEWTVACAHARALAEAEALETALETELGAGPGAMTKATATKQAMAAKQALAAAAAAAAARPKAATRRALKSAGEADGRRDGRAGGGNAALGAFGSAHLDAAANRISTLGAQALGRPTVPNVKWADVGGQQEAKRAILETVQLLITS